MLKISSVCRRWGGQQHGVDRSESSILFCAAQLSFLSSFLPFFLSLFLSFFFFIPLRLSVLSLFSPPNFSLNFNFFFQLVCGVCDPTTNYYRSAKKAILQTLKGYCPFRSNSSILLFFYATIII